jgi:uncharacterized protein YndB with AHSA1/START domain/uncharacterized membrane protein YkvA (DUF1232 family)
MTSSLAAKLKARARELKTEIFALYLAARHPGTPWYAKLFMLAIVAYALSPIDLIPDFIPVLGYLDDIVLLPIGIILAVKMVPAVVMSECRTRALAETLDGTRAGRIAAAVIVLLWLTFAVIAAIWAHNAFAIDRPKPIDPSPQRSQIMSDQTVRLHRVLRAKPEKVYRAFVDANALAKWLPPYGFTCTVHHLEARVGGTFRMSFHNFSTGNGHSFGGEYLELVQGERVRYTDKFDDPNMPGVMEVTVTLKPVIGGTEMSITQSNIPAAIPVEMCYLGWQESLAQMATLVEPEIPG